MTVGDGRPPALPLNVPCSCGRQGQGRRPAARPLTASSQGKCAQIWPAGAADDSNQGMDWCLTGAALSNMARAAGTGPRHRAHAQAQASNARLPPAWARTSGRTSETRHLEVGPMARVEGTVLIQASLDSVYSLAKRVEDFPRFMPDLEP